jgi:hypothetical protein
MNKLKCAAPVRVVLLTSCPNALFISNNSVFKCFSHKNNFSSVSNLASNADDSLSIATYTSINDGENTDGDANTPVTRTAKTRAAKAKAKAEDSNTGNASSSIAKDQFPDTISIEELRNDDNKLKKGYKGRIKTEKQKELDKAKSAKKTRIKNKFMQIIPILNNIANLRAPASILYAVKRAKLEMFELDQNQQKLILTLGSKLTAEQLAIMFLLVPDTTDEIKFLKDTILSKKWIDMMFNSIDFNLVTLAENKAKKNKETVDKSTDYED